MERNGLSCLDGWVQRHMRQTSHQIVTIGLIMLFAFPALGWIWSIWDGAFKEALPFRVLGSAFGAGLVLSPYWSDARQRFLSWYWFLALLYALPYFFAYSFLLNQASDVASMSMLISIFILIFLVDVWMLWLIFILGTGLAFLTYFIVTPHIHLNAEHGEVAIGGIFILLLGSLMSIKNAMSLKQRMSGMAAAAGMIAHELRTPLLGMKSGAQALKERLPDLIAGYELAKQHDLIEKPIRSNRLAQLSGVSERMIREIDYANTIIDMLLIKSGQERSFDQCEFETCSMAACIEETLERYPFRPGPSRDLIEWSGDFQFIGSKLLMQHVLFNLLKNALYFIEKNQKGRIEIWTGETKHYNLLHFKDTAKGMSRAEQSKLFNDFYTTTFMGTGIGLTFCKRVMTRFGGDIVCEAKEGVYTQLTLWFPKKSIKTH